MEQNPFERLTSYLLVKNSPTFYRTWRFIATFTSAYNLSVSWARSICSIPPHPTSWRSILILSSHLRLVLQSRLFPPPKPCMHLSSPLYMLKPRPFYSKFHHPNSIWWGVQFIQLLIIQFSPLPCYLVPLRPKYSPQHLTLEHPQQVFLLQCERPIFIHTK